MATEDEKYNRFVEEFTSSLRQGADEIVSGIHRLLLEERSTIEAYANKVEMYQRAKDFRKEQPALHPFAAGALTGAVTAVVGGLCLFIFDRLK